MKRNLALILSLSFFGSVIAKISHCVVNVSHACVTLTTSSNDSYITHIPTHLEGSMQAICDDDTLYINESHTCPNESISVAVPHGVSFELNVRQQGRVVIESVTGPLQARLQERAGIHIKSGNCPQLDVVASGHATFVSELPRIGRAVIVGKGPVNLVVDAIEHLQAIVLSKGAVAYCNKNIHRGGTRASDEVPFSLAHAYRCVGLSLSPELSFYDLCATENEQVHEGDCDQYEENPLLADDAAVVEARNFIESMQTDTASITAAIDYISRISPEKETARQVLGALLCRRLMIKPLAKPWGAGAVSPVSLLKPHAFMEPMHREQALLCLEEFLQGAERIAASDITALGSFGAAFCERVGSLRRFHDRLSRMRSARSQPRWAPFLAQLFRDTQTFITTGRRPW